MYKYLFLLLIAITSDSIYANEDEYLAVAMNVAKLPEGEKLDALINSIVSSQIKTNPSMRLVKKAFETYYRELFTSDEYKLGMAKIQMELFTYEELLELQKLMKRPIFVKYKEIAPQLVKKHMELGSKTVLRSQERLKELVKKERDHIEKLQQLDKEQMIASPK